MGRTQCYRANVAYTLYGIPKGSSNQKRKNNPCSQGNYINSFFTTQGVEYFANEAGIDYGDATSYCSVLAGDDDGMGDDTSQYEHNQALYPNYSSYTTTCSTTHSFVQATFGGAYCSGPQVSITDTLDDVNGYLNDLECVQIYSADNDGDDDNNNANADDDEGDADEGDADEGDADEGDADDADDGDRRRLENSLFDLLSYSTTCNILEYPLSCPDPWGAKALIDFNPARDMLKTPLYKKMTWVDWLAGAIWIAALVLLLIPCCCMPSPERREKRRRRRRVRHDDGKPVNKTNKDNKDDKDMDSSNHSRRSRNDDDDEERRTMGDRMRGMGRKIKKVFRRRD
jgi:hypothetical protein